MRHNKYRTEYDTTKYGVPVNDIKRTRREEKRAIEGSRMLLEAVLRYLEERARRQMSND